MKNKEADTELESRLLEILVHPCRIEDIRRELPNAGKNNLKNALDALIADGRVMKNKKNRFAVSAHYGCVAGTYLATERAFAFVAPDYPEGEAKPDDLFIPPNASGGAWHGDRVLVKVSERKNNRGRKEATVIRVLGRAGKELTGELVQRGKAFFVQPTSKMTSAKPPSVTAWLFQSRTTAMSSLCRRALSARIWAKAARWRPLSRLFCTKTACMMYSRTRCSSRRSPFRRRSIWAPPASGSICATS